MLIRWAELYANTEILSPIDLQTWQVIGDVAGIGASSRVLELASGKGAFANYLAKRFGSKVEGFDINPEFVDYSSDRAMELGLRSRVRFANADITRLEVAGNIYDLGACLGALYSFRENGWKVLAQAVKSGGFIAVSDLICKKTPAPKEVMDAFFEEPNQPLTLDDARRWYTSRGVKVLREVECSRTAWLNYYDLTKRMLLQISSKQTPNKALQLEVQEGLREDALVRKYGQEYLDYVTFIMQKT